MSGRATGLAASTVSGWETGRTRAVLSNQELVCRLYECTRVDLGFDEALAATARLDVVTSYVALLDAMVEVVDSAHEHLAVTGSRSREASYLERIENAVVGRPHLAHWRVLFGPLRHPLVRSHLVRMAELGRDNVHIGLVADVLQQPERFIVASEAKAVLVLPSAVAVDQFDSGLVVDDPTLAGGWVQHVRHAYAGAEPLGRDTIMSMPIVR